MQIKACNVASNISSVIGNATSYYLYFLMNKFPEGFFKDTYISGALASVVTENEDIYKKSKPTLIVKPVYTGENGIMEQLPYWHNTYVHTFKNSKARYQYNRVLYDNKNNIFIHSIPDRIKLTFETKIILPTTMYAYNVLHHVKNIFETGGYFYINDVKLDNEIPKIFTLAIADKLGLNLNNFEEKEKFESYLLEQSYNGIEEKRNLSTGNFEYSYKYPTNILVNIIDTPSIDVEKNNNVEDKATVSFQISFEFWTQSNYILEITDFDETKLPQGFFSDGSYRFDITVPFNWIQEIIDNYHLLYRKKFICEVNRDVDELGFDSIISKEIINVIDILKENKKDISKVAKILIVCNNKLMTEEVDYTVNWENYTVSILNPMHNTTFTFLFYGDLKVLNSINNDLIEKNITKIKKIEL